MYNVICASGLADACQNIWIIWLYTLKILMINITVPYMHICAFADLKWDCTKIHMVHFAHNWSFTCILWAMCKEQDLWLIKYDWIAHIIMNYWLCATWSMLIWGQTSFWSANHKSTFCTGTVQKYLACFYRVAILIPFPGVATLQPKQVAMHRAMHLLQSNRAGTTVQ